MNDVSVIVIGRNEGDRLRGCLASVVGRGMPVIYVDSGSSDGSIALARSLGAEVVELDMSVPFSAARARNAGVDHLLVLAPATRFVQFIDGDCELREGWIAQAVAALDAQADVAVVCGRRRERRPEASLYNRLADLEWDTPVGQAKSCGGDAMMRLAAFRRVGGFNSSVVAGEEPELCQRLRNAGWKVLRIDAEMTWHDAAIVRFSQWWRRQVRSGYGATDVATRFRQADGPLFVRQLRSAETWTTGWLSTLFLAAIAGGAIGQMVGARRQEIMLACALAGIVLLAWPVQAIRLAARTYRRTRDAKIALGHGVLTMIGKWGFRAGRNQYFRDRRAGRLTRLIDYKAEARASSPPIAPAA